MEGQLALYNQEIENLRSLVVSTWTRRDVVREFKAICMPSKISKLFDLEPCSPSETFLLSYNSKGVLSFSELEQVKLKKGEKPSKHAIWAYDNLGRLKSHYWIQKPAPRELGSGMILVGSFPDEVVEPIKEARNSPFLGIGSQTSVDPDRDRDFFSVNEFLPYVQYLGAATKYGDLVFYGKNSNGNEGLFLPGKIIHFLETSEGRR